MIAALLASRPAAGALPVAIAALICLNTAARSAEPGRLEHGFGSPAQSEVDLAGLTQGVRETRAIGLLAKLEVKQKTERLLTDMERFHSGRGGHQLTGLRARFDALLSWLVSLVWHGDPELHDQLVASRDALWHRLADPVAFRELPHLARRLDGDHGR